MTNKLTTFIPAGGRGSRLRPHTFSSPKPLLLMGSSETRIIDHPLDLASETSDHIWVSVDYLADQMEEYLEGRPNVSILRDGTTIGSGGSLIEHYEKLSDLESDGDFLVLPSDHIYDGDFDIGKYLDDHRESDADITLLTVPRKTYGEYVKVDGRQALAIEKQPNVRNVSTTGTYMFRNSFILNVLRNVQRSERPLDLNIYKDIVCPSVGKVAVSSRFIDRDTGYWEDTGTSERFLRSNMRLSGGRNVISNSAEIADDVELRRCVVLGNVAIKEHLHIEDAIISSDSKGNLLISS